MLQEDSRFQHSRAEHFVLHPQKIDLAVTQFSHCVNDSVPYFVECRKQQFQLSSRNSRETGLEPIDDFSNRGWFKLAEAKAIAQDAYVFRRLLAYIETQIDANRTSTTHDRSAAGADNPTDIVNRTGTFNDH